MPTQATSKVIERNEIAGQGGFGQRLALFVLFFVCELAVFIFGAPYFDVFPTNRNAIYAAALAVVFLAAAMGLKRTARGAQYWRSAYALFVALAAILCTQLFGGFSNTVLGWFNVTADTSQGAAIAKVYEVVMIVVPIIVLVKLSGADLGSLYLKRGNLKPSLAIGVLVFFNFAASAFLFFATRYTSMDRLGTAVVWGLVFSFANGFMEELWLRGLFLRRFEPLLGQAGTILLTSLIFSLMHSGAVYLTPVAMPFMLVNTLTMGLTCGYLMMKTDNIWGATLIHAAADFFLFIAMLAAA